MEVSLCEPGVKGQQKELWEQSEQTQPSGAPRSAFFTDTVGIHSVIEPCLWTSSVTYWFLADSHRDLDFSARNSHAGYSCWKTINWASQSIYCEMKYLLCTSVWLYAVRGFWMGYVVWIQAYWFAINFNGKEKSMAFSLNNHQMCSGKCVRCAEGITVNITCDTLIKGGLF